VIQYLHCQARGVGMDRIDNFPVISQLRFPRTSVQICKLGADNGESILGYDQLSYRFLKATQNIGWELLTTRRPCRLGGRGSIRSCKKRHTIFPFFGVSFSQGEIQVDLNRCE
jgi:hypothetical protein